MTMTPEQSQQIAQAPAPLAVIGHTFTVEPKGLVDLDTP